MKRTIESTETLPKFVYCEECFVKVERTKWRQHPSFCRHRDVNQESDIRPTTRAPSSFIFDGIAVNGDKLEVVQRRPGNKKYNDEHWSAATVSTPIWSHLLNEKIPATLKENLEERQLALKIYAEMYGSENQYGKEEFHRVKKLFDQVLETRKTLLEEANCGVCFKSVNQPESYYCYINKNQLCAKGGQVHIMCTSCKWAIINESLFTDRPAYGHGYCQNCFANVGGEYEFISSRQFSKY